MSFRIELSFLPSSEMNKVSRDAIRQQKINSAPVGKRAAMEAEMGKCQYCGDADCDCSMLDEEEEENEVKVGMSNGEMPSTSEVTNEDLPRGVKIPAKPPKAQLPKRIVKNGKKS
jgi:hypothetical protein